MAWQDGRGEYQNFGSGISKGADVTNAIGWTIAIPVSIQNHLPTKPPTNTVATPTLTPHPHQPTLPAAAAAAAAALLQWQQRQQQRQVAVQCSAIKCCRAMSTTVD